MEGRVRHAASLGKGNDLTPQSQLREDTSIQR